MKNYYPLSISILFLSLSIMLFSYKDNQTTTTKMPEKSVLAHVLEKRKIRCGYVLYPPFIDRNVKTNKLVGPMAEIWQAIGQRLDLQIDWAEETSWSNMITGLKIHRYDAVCSPVWANATRSKFVAFSTPFGYESIGAWQSKNTNLTANDLNISTTRIATLDGEMSSMLATRIFPQAQKISLPQSASIGEAIQQIITRKADIVLLDNLTAQEFLSHNPDQIMPVPQATALQFFPVTVLLPQNNANFKDMIDQTIQELVQDGTIQKIMTQHGYPQQWHWPKQAGY